MLANQGYYRYINKHGGGASSLAFLFVGKSFQFYITLANLTPPLQPHSRRSERWQELHLVLLAAHRFNGIERCDTKLGIGYASCQAFDRLSFRLWRYVQYDCLDYKDPTKHLMHST